MKKAVFGFLAVAILVSTSLPLLAEQPAPSAGPAEVPVWLAGLAPSAGLSFLPQPIPLTACAFPERSACTQGCRQECRAIGCFGGGGVCTLEDGCICGECVCP